MVIGMTTCPAPHFPGLWHDDGRCAWITAPDADDIRCPERATRLHGPLHLCERHRRVAEGLDTYIEIHQDLFAGVRAWHAGQMGDAALHDLVIADEQAIRIARPHLVAQELGLDAAFRTLAGREVDVLAAAAVRQVETDRARAQASRTRAAGLATASAKSAVATPADAG